MSVFWQQYLAGSSVKAEELTNRLWQGITDPTIRKRVWEAAADKSIHEQKVDLRALSEDMRNDIELELVPGHFAHFNPPLDENDRTNVLYLLEVDAVMHERKHYIQGYAQLVARMLTVLDNDVKLCMGVLHRLSGKLKEYHQQGPDFPVLRTDVLVLADILSRELPDAVAHFNANQFDVVDLSDVVVVWCLSLFASQFPADVVIRMIDIVLFEGCHSLIALVYGIIKVSAKGLMTKHGDALFQSFTDIPVNMNKLQIADSFAIGYKTFRMNEKIINELRKQKHWFKTLEMAVGPVIFMKDVGNPNCIKPLAASESSMKRPQHPGTASSNTATSPIAPVQLSSYSTHTMPASVTFNLDALSVHEHESHPSSPRDPNNLMITVAPLHPNNTDLLNQLTRAKLEQDLTILHRLLDQSINEITRQNQYIHSIQTIDYHSNRTSMSSNSHSVTSSPSQRGINDTVVTQDTNSLRTVSTRERAGMEEDPVVRAKLLAASPLLVHSSERRSSIKKPPPMNGVVKFSELTDYQVFPCIYMEGYLMKSRAPSKLFKRRASSGFFGNLHRRFFILQGSFVTYFKSHSFKKPSRDESIDMRSCKVIALKNHEFGPYAFQINWNLHKQTSCLYLLFANNETVRDIWVEVLTRASTSPN